MKCFKISVLGLATIAALCACGKTENKAASDATKQESATAAPPVATIAQNPCADAMLNIGNSLDEWLQHTQTSCSKLSPAEQSTAAKEASAKSASKINFYPFPEALNFIKAGKLPFIPAPASAEEEMLALSGIYQAQRNYAFSLKQKGDAMNACAWRTVIATSGQKMVNQTDIDNFKVDCSALDATQQTAASSKVEQLRKNISSVKLDAWLK